MMYLYNTGFVAIFLLFVLLYYHAWRRRDMLELDARERFMTLERLGANVIFIIVGLISTSIVFAGGSAWSGIAGLAYALNAPLLTIYFSITNRKLRSIAD